MEKLKPEFALGGFLPRAWDAQASPKNLAAMTEDERWMTKAFLVGMNGVGWSAPNPAVGCVIVKDGVQISEGFTQAYTHEHAEKMAFKKIIESHQQDALKGATVYVTLEPCAHQGHQPPCLDLILNSPIKKVVIACEDPDVRVSGKSIEALTRAKKEVVMGVLGNECRAWHLPFIKKQQHPSKIFIAAKWAQTPSGLLADAVGKSQWITGERSRAYVHWLRQKYDAIMVGARTWTHDRPRLTVRDCAEPHRRNPTRLVFDPQGSLMKMPNLSLHGESPLIIFTDEQKLMRDPPPPLKGVEWIPLAQGKTLAQSLYEELNQLPIQSVMVEGGPFLLDLLFEANLIDVCHEFRGKREFDNASSHYKLKRFNKNEYNRVVEQKIDDDDLHEWIK